MTNVLNKFSDKLVQRLVPKTNATACVSPEASWYEYCGCGWDPSLGWRHRWKECSVCGGVTGCSKCIYATNPC